MDNVTTVEVVGYVALCIMAILSVTVLWRICGEIAWHAAWRWSETRQIVRNVRLGWNAGPPPHDQWLLVANHVDHYPRDGDLRTWAIMIRRGDTMHTLGGGMSMPARNAVGWLSVTDSEPAGDTGATSSASSE